MLYVVYNIACTLDGFFCLRAYLKYFTQVKCEEKNRNKLGWSLGGAQTFFRLFFIQVINFFNSVEINYLLVCNIK